MQEIISLLLLGVLVYAIIKNLWFLLKRVWFVALIVFAIPVGLYMWSLLFRAIAFLM